MREPLVDRSSVSEEDIKEIIKKYSIPISWLFQVVVLNDRLHNGSGSYLALTESLFAVGGLRLSYFPTFYDLSSVFDFYLS